MSRKKTSSGNTMSLKDFHGGIIPTELPLPSAPGVIVRSKDWSGYDQPKSWGGLIGRPDHRVRPRSSPAFLHWDDRMPFLTDDSRIGRYYDEDERKPVNGFSAPRRTFSDETFLVAPSKVESKPQPAFGGRVSGPALGTSFAGSQGRRFHEGAHAEVHSQNVGGYGRQRVGGSSLSAWTAREESIMGVNEQVRSAWSEASAVSKLVHASALEKVSSGRWQINHLIHTQTQTKVVEGLGAGKGSGSNVYDGCSYNRIDAASGRKYSDTMLGRHVECGLAVEDGIQGHRNKLAEHHEISTPLYSELKERDGLINGEKVEPPYSDAKIAGSILQSPVQSEAPERPEVNSLPRIKPLEDSEPPIVNHKQGSRRPSHPAHDHVETRNELQRNVIAAKPGFVGLGTENRMVERRKLNLRPRSQPLEHLDGNVNKERNLLFGGARPRELVLKERGIYDAAIRNHELDQRFNRTNHNFSKTGGVPNHAYPTHNAEITRNLPLDQKLGKTSDRMDQYIGTERVDVQRRNWHNENQRRNGDTRRRRRQQQQQLHKERHPSPETWRKPVEQPKPASLDVGLRYGKIASALELAQAFSRPLSDSKSGDRYSVQRSLPGYMHMPFSRLTIPIPRHGINGY